MEGDTVTGQDQDTPLISTPGITSDSAGAAEENRLEHG